VDKLHSADFIVNGTAERDCLYSIKIWPLHSETTAGQKNMAHPILVDKPENYLPPLHIKHGLIKVFVKAVNKESESFGYLRREFPTIREAKMKERIFVGPQIKQLLEDRDFSTRAI